MRKLIAVFAFLSMGALSAAAFAEQIDNPEYAQWAKYKVGTFVSIQQTTEMPGMNTADMPAGMNMANMMPKNLITTKVTDIKPDAVTLEIATTSSMMGQTNQTTTTRTVPAKIENPTTTTAPTGRGAAADMREGRETLEIKGKSIETTTREFTTTVNLDAAGMADARGPGRARGAGRRGAAASGTPARVKVWSSNDIPGGMAKTESTTTVDQMGDVKMIMVVVDYSVAK